MELKAIGHGFEQHIHEVNLPAFRVFRNTLEQRAYSPSTVRTYLAEFAQLLKLLKQRPVDRLTTEQLNAYFLYCIKKLKHSENQIHSRINAIKSYFKLVLHQEHVFDSIPRPKSPKALPKVLSKQEVIRLFSVIQNSKHLLMLKLCYGMGLRVSEIVNLKVQDIDSTRMQVLIQSAKGKKDRYVNLPESVLEDLRKVLITVKTYPTISGKYDELVCTAGFREDGTWVRIYPIPFRKKAYDQQYKKYDWVEIDLDKNKTDFRPESYRPHAHDTAFDIVGHIATPYMYSEIIIPLIYISKSLLLLLSINHTLFP